MGLLVVIAALVAPLLLTGSVGTVDAPEAKDPSCAARAAWIEKLLAEHQAGTWAPIPVEATDEDLTALGLPPGHVLAERRYPEPTAFLPDGSTKRVDRARLMPEAPSPGTSTAALPLAAYAGTGCVGIRPGALVLFIQGNFPLGGWSISICSLAHVYGSPGAYDISTAGHCAKTGQIATVVGVVGGNIPVLLDFGKVAKSQDGGLGRDWALIDIFPSAQALTTPNMCAWGGPFFGAYAGQGQVVDVDFPRNSIVPKVTVTPDPALVQALEHYGHGLGVGAGGTPRAATAIAWLQNHFMFFGAINQGDSGSGVNTATSQAAGIVTHIWIDPLMREGVGIMGGTRATVVGDPASTLPVFVPVPGTGL